MVAPDVSHVVSNPLPLSEFRGAVYHFLEYAFCVNWPDGETGVDNGIVVMVSPDGLGVSWQVSGFDT